VYTCRPIDFKRARYLLDGTGSVFVRFVLYVWKISVHDSHRIEIEIFVSERLVWNRFGRVWLRLVTFRRTRSTAAVRLSSIGWPTRLVASPVQSVFDRSWYVNMVRKENNKTEQLPTTNDHRVVRRRVVFPRDFPVPFVIRPRERDVGNPVTKSRYVFSPRVCAQRARYGRRRRFVSVVSVVSVVRRRRRRHTSKHAAKCNFVTFPTFGKQHAPRG